METVFLTGVLCLISGLALIGVFAPYLDDTLIQRLGLSCISIGSLSMASWCRLNDIPGAMVVMIIGVALFMVATAFKLYKAHYGALTGRRRSTDKRADNEAISSF